MSPLSLLIPVAIFSTAVGLVAVILQIALFVYFSWLGAFGLLLLAPACWICFVVPWQIVAWEIRDPF